MTSTSASTRPGTTPAPRRSSATAATGTGRTCCRLAVEHPLHASFFVDKLWSYFVPRAPSASTRSSLIKTYRSNGYAIRPVLEAILMHPDLYLGPPMVKPPVVHLAGLLRALGRHIDDDSWIWLSEQAGQLLFWPPNVSGWDDSRWLDTSRMRARWLEVTYALDGRAFDAWDEPYDETEEPENAMDRALATYGYPPIRVEQHNELLRLARTALNGADAELAAGPLPRAAPERPASAARRLPRPDAGMSAPGHSCCSNYTRSRLLRGAAGSVAAEAGRGLPAIETGMPTPAGTGLTRRTFLSRAQRARARRLRRDQAAARCLRGGDRPAPRRRTGCWSRSSSTAASTRSACWRPTGDSNYAQLRPTLALAPERRHRLQRGLAPALAPRGPGSVDAPRRGQGLGLPRDRLQRAPTSRTSPLATTARSARSRSARAPAGSAATWTSSATTTTRCRDCRWTASLFPALATASKPVAAIDSVDDYDLWSHVDEPIEGRYVRQLRAHRKRSLRLPRR